MSRSRKKVPTYGYACKWGLAKKKASKRAERRAVKNALHTGNWDIMPKPGEVGPKWIPLRKRSIHDEDYFLRNARLNREVFRKANQECMYVFQIKDKHPYDWWREWLLEVQSSVIDKDNSWSYTAMYRELQAWLPIYNSRPIDIRWTDKNYIKNYHKRK